MRTLLAELTRKGFNVAELVMDHTGDVPGEITVRLQVQGKGHLSELAVGLSQLEGVSRVAAGDSNEITP